MNFRKESKMTKTTLNTVKTIKWATDDVEITPADLELLDLEALIHIANTHPAHIKIADPRTDDDQTLDEWNRLAKKYAPKPKVLLSEDDCNHEREHPVIGAIRCPSCGRRRDPVGQFEMTLVSRLTPRDSGYVNWKLG
jgi:hypothetical protein